MIRSLALVALALSGSALAVTTTYVYPVAKVEKLADGTDAITTPRGLTVYVNCAKATFDDSEHDWVSGFSSKEECTHFVDTAKKNIGHAEIELANIALTIRVIH